MVRCDWFWCIWIWQALSSEWAAIHNIFRFCKQGSKCFIIKLCDVVFKQARENWADSTNQSLPYTAHVGGTWYIHFKFDPVTILWEKKVLDSFGVYFFQSSSKLISCPSEVCALVWSEFRNFTWWIGGGRWWRSSSPSYSEFPNG